tara:strand:+ start:7450 stop:7857 length:408 start_codon:yes stop_codon:yes gene_type:complete
MAAITANTTTFSYDGTAIADVVSLTAPSVSIATIDTTSIADIYRTFLGGTIDSGEMSIEIQYDPNSTSGAELEASWEATATVAPVEKECIITFSDSSTYTFNAILTSFSATAAIDAVVTASVGLKVSGAITIAGS